METNDLNKELTELLKCKEFAKASDYFTNDEKRPELSKHADVLLPLIVEAIVDETTTEDDFERCKTWIGILTSCIPPKESLLFLLEQFEQHSSVYLLTHLKDVLLLMPAKRGSSLEWVLNTVSSHVMSLPLPNDYNLEGEERKLLDLDPDVKLITDALPFYIDFLKPFVFEVSLINTNEGKIFLPERIQHQRNVLRGFITDIFGQLLFYLDLQNNPNDAKSTARVIAEKLLCFLTQLEGNVLKLCIAPADVSRAYSEMKDCSSVQIEKNLSENDRRSFLGKATLAYLLFAENTGSSVNLVYTGHFLLREHLKYIIAFLIKPVNVAVHKGLLLMKSLLEKIPTALFHTDMLELPETIAVVRCLFNVMINSQVKEFRETGLALFESYVSKFHSKAKSQLLCSLIQILTHSGAKSLIIRLFKEGIHEEMRDLESHGYFLNETLINFISLTIVLPNDVETDILDHSDEILATLNLLRYLYQADKQNIDRTGVWKILNKVRKKFVEPLRMGLDLSRAHYQLEIRNMNQNRGVQSTSGTVSVGGAILPNLTREQQIEMYNSAIIFFDMIESVLVRLEEIINQDKGKE